MLITPANIYKVIAHASDDFRPFLVVVNVTASTKEEAAEMVKIYCIEKGYKLITDSEWEEEAYSRNSSNQPGFISFISGKIYYLEDEANQSQ